jgi:hypothetical protein
MMMDEGFMWCGEIPSTSPGPAMAYYQGNPHELPIWEDAVEEEGQPRACRCAHSALDAFLDDLDGSANPLQILTSTQEDWELEGAGGVGPVTFRNDIYAAVKARCHDLAAVQHPEADDDPPNNCDTAIDEIETGGVTPIVRTQEECVAEMNYGPDGEMAPLPGDSWSDYFVLNNVITYYSGANLYVINGGFFLSVVETPAWLIEDGAFIAPNTTGDFQFYNVNSGSIAYALGIRTGDIPQTLNSIDVTTMEGAFEAWEDLQAETGFELVVLRGTNTITLEYYVAYM